MENFQYSLTELLLVSAILIVLLSILLPSLQRILIQSKHLACSNTLARSGIVFALYEDANNGLGPRPSLNVSYNSLAATSVMYWWDSLHNVQMIDPIRPFGLLDTGSRNAGSLNGSFYLANTDTGFVCFFGKNIADPFRGKFFSNKCWYHDSDRRWIGYLNLSYSCNRNMGTKRILIHPGSLIRQFDHMGRRDFNRLPYPTHPVEYDYLHGAFERHGWKINFLFHDGHVESAAFKGPINAYGKFQNQTSWTP